MLARRGILPYTGLLLFAASFVACNDVATNPAFKSTPELGSNEVVGLEGAPTELTCGQTITTNVALSNDLLDCPGTAITVGADAIVIDGRGHTVAGQDLGSGVAISGHNGVTVRNLRITHFSNGVSLYQATGNRIVHNEFAENNQGVRAHTATENKISHNTFTGDFLPVRLLNDADRNEVLGNVISGSGSNAITLQYNQGNTVAGNLASNSGSYVITLYATHDNVVELNRVSEGIGAGFRLSSGSTGNTLRNNIASGMTQAGFWLDASSSNTLFNNSAFRNGTHGFYLTAGSVDNQLSNNNAVDNGVYGYMDVTSGTGSVGTGNLYELNRCRDNQGGESSPPGLCR